MVSHTVSLRFSLSHPNIDPNEVTRITGLTPSLQTQTGVIPGGGTRPSRLTVWEINSPASEAASSIDEQWQALEPLLLPHVAVWKSAPLGSAHMVAIVEAMQICPGITVPMGLMKFLSDIGAELEFDCYITNEYVLQAHEVIRNE